MRIKKKHGVKATRSATFAIGVQGFVWNLSVLPSIDEAPSRPSYLCVFLRPLQNLEGSAPRGERRPSVPGHDWGLPGAEAERRMRGCWGLWRSRGNTRTARCQDCQ